ncbi:MAG TPA: PQQ-binding-like beta-propeller repeat protein [Flavobacteriales bacterium]|nr:PQQ-binding-like beta-propeller repeat protein [Flavobacteriales bacterium]
MRTHLPALRAMAVALLLPVAGRAQVIQLLPVWPQANGVVEALRVDANSNVLYVAGNFTEIDGQPRERLAAIDILTGSLLPWNPSANGIVNDIEVAGDSVVVTGAFSEINGIQRSRLAAIDATTGGLRNWSPSLDNTGQVLLVDDDRIIVGGFFSFVNGVPRGRAAAFNGGTGSLLSWNPAVDGFVRSIKRIGSSVLLAGLFNSAGGQSRMNMAMIDAVSGLATGWQANTNAVVAATSVSGGSILLGGQFTEVNGTSRNRLAAVSIADGTLLPWSADIGITGSGGVRCINEIPGMVMVGGFYSHVNGQVHGNLAGLDSGTGALLTNLPSATTTVSSIIVHDNRIIIGGAFTAVSPGGPRLRLAAFSYCYESAWYADGDGDGFGNPDAMVMSCTAPVGYVADNSDCDDTDLDIQGPTIWFADADGDGFGDPNSTMLACTAPAGFVSNALDCDDTELTVFPGAACDDGDPFTFDDALLPFPECDCIGQQGISVSAKAILQGPYSVFSGMMADDLRIAGLIPLTEPYTALGYDPVGVLPQSGATIDASVLDPNPTPLTDVVDWVILELRNANDGSVRIATRYALILRFGDIVDLDGASPVSFAVPPGDYRVAVLHRNHKGLVTAESVSLPGPSIDFRSAGLLVANNSIARASLGTVVGLINGDVTFNDFLSYTGNGNDRDPILAAIGGVIPSNVAFGYHSADVNMDGVIKYTGQANDRDPILTAVGGTTPTSTLPNTYLHTNP